MQIETKTNKTKGTVTITVSVASAALLLWNAYESMKARIDTSFTGQIYAAHAESVLAEYLALVRAFPNELG